MLENYLWRSISTTLPSAFVDVNWRSWFARVEEVQPRHLGRLLAEQGGGDEDGGGARDWKIISGKTIHKYGGVKSYFPKSRSAWS